MKAPQEKSRPSTRGPRRDQERSGPGLAFPANLDGWFLLRLSAGQVCPILQAGPRLQYHTLPAK